MERKTRAARPLLTAADWVQAALAAIAEGGLAAIAVEPLARRLGATKGSFYWHFPNRDALIAAALQEWERAETHAPIQRLGMIRDPAERLRAVTIAAVTDRAGGLRDAALSASADHPLVKPLLERVTTSRLRFLTAAYEQLGWPPAQAAHRALLLYTPYVGLFHYLRAAAGPGPTDTQLHAYADDLVTALVTRA